MKKIKKCTALLLILALSLSLCACGEDTGASGYRVLDSIGTEEFSVAFRQGDRLSDIVSAALLELAYDGTVGRISKDWFGSDLTMIEGDGNALEALGEEISARIFIMGLDPNSYPMSYKDENGNYAGFDVELATAVCNLLGWEIKFQPISPADVAVELAAGNVDCAWGGMSFDAALEVYSLSPVYMENEQVLVVKSDSGIKRVGRLSGKTLYIQNSDSAEAAFAANEELSKKIGEATRLEGDARDCFARLDSGSCDAILIDSIAANYIMFWD